jgi:hypothetical protein
MVSDARQCCFLYGQICESANVVCSVSCENRVAPSQCLCASTESVFSIAERQVGLKQRVHRLGSVQASVSATATVNQSAATASQVSAKSNAAGIGCDGDVGGNITVSFSNAGCYSSLCYRVMTVFMYLSTNGTTCFITCFIS